MFRSELRGIADRASEGPGVHGHRGKPLLDFVDHALEQRGEQVVA
jgi:hypothetical protein